MVQPLGSETMEEKHVSHMGSKTMAGTQHDSHMGSQSMEKQPTGSKHSCCKLSSSTATGLLQDILDIFLLAQEDFCLAWPLWSPHFLVFALALDMAFLVLPWPLLVWPFPFMAAGWVLAAGFLAAAWALAFWSWSWSQSSCGFLQWTKIFHSSKGWTWSSSGRQPCIMVALAAGFLMGMAAGTEAHSWAWPWLQEGGNAFEPHGLTVAMWLHQPWKETT